jgi:hypothetical protein
MAGATAQPLFPSTFPKYSAIFHPDKRRYAVLYSFENEDKPIDIFQPAITAVEKGKNYNCIIVKDAALSAGPQRHSRFSTLSLMKQGAEQKQVWGYTGEKLYYTPISDWIPVVCLHPGFPDGMEVWYHTPLAYPFKREPDGRADSEHVREYLAVKETLARLPPPAPPDPAAPSPIPPFVGEALLATARQKGEICPISMTPYKELSEVGITPCYHIFDPPSLEKWLLTNKCCPACKQHVVQKSILLLTTRPA